MAIWVSRYSNKELRKGNYYPVGISLGTPKWPLGYEVREQCYSLAPKGFMLNLEKDEYREAYFQKLDDLGREKIFGIVSRLDEKARAENKELVLLCYEDVRNPDEWCHRTMFAEWWGINVGEVIEELPDSSIPKSKKKEISKPIEEKPKEVYEQLSLF